MLYHKSHIRLLIYRNYASVHSWIQFRNLILKCRNDFQNVIVRNWRNISHRMYHSMQLGLKYFWQICLMNDGIVYFFKWEKNTKSITCPRLLQTTSFYSPYKLILVGMSLTTFGMQLSGVLNKHFSGNL